MAKEDAAAAAAAADDAEANGDANAAAAEELEKMGTLRAKTQLRYERKRRAGGSGGALRGPSESSGGRSPEVSVIEGIEVKSSALEIHI